MSAVWVHAVVEGDLDEAVARRLIEHAGALPGYVYGRKGKGYFRDHVGRFAAAAARTPSPWLVLVDLDDDDPCAPGLLRAWLPRPAPRLCLRVAVRTVEAWLLADREAMARFLRVPATTLPLRPEEEPNPKLRIVAAARRSQSRDIREDLVPRQGSGLAVGPAYQARLSQFAAGHWRPDAAASRAPSLARCLNALGELVRSAAP